MPRARPVDFPPRGSKLKAILAVGHGGRGPLPKEKVWPLMPYVEHCASIWTRAGTED